MTLGWEVKYSRVCVIAPLGDLGFFKLTFPSDPDKKSSPGCSVPEYIVYTFNVQI